MQDDLKTDERTMPLLDHLIELRSRLIYSVVAILLLFFICYYFAPSIYNFLVAPLADVLEQMGGQRRLIFTALHEAFFTYIKVAFFAALFLSFPFLAMQVWMFIAPGLYKNEKKGREATEEFRETIRRKDQEDHRQDKDSRSWNAKCCQIQTRKGGEKSL